MKLMIGWARFSRSQSAAGFTRWLKSYGRCRRRGQCSGNGHQFGPAGQRILSVAIIGDLTSGGFAVGLGAECSAFRAVRFGKPALRIAVVVLVLVLLILIVVVAAVVDDDDAESVESIQTQW